MTKAIIHIGLHKTGSTSTQKFLGDNRGKLHSLGVAFYEGFYLRDNHVDLQVAAIRRERDTPFKLGRQPLTSDERAAIVAKVASFCQAEAGRTLLFSNEGISYLRYPDEIERLKAIVPATEIRIVVCLRNKTDFLASYQAGISRKVPANVERDSFAYTEADSWLLDYERRLDLFRAAFGEVEVIDYDVEVERSGSIIPSFLRLLGLEEAFSPSDWRGYNLNRRRTKVAVPSRT